MGFFDAAPLEWFQRPAGNSWDPPAGQFGHPVSVAPLLLASVLPGLPDPCAGVPANAFCRALRS